MAVVDGRYRFLYVTVEAQGSSNDAAILMDTSSSLSSLNAYPHIKNLYVSLNTAFTYLLFFLLR